MRTSNILAIASIAVVIVLFGSFLCSGEQEEQDPSFIILHSNDTHCYYGDDGSLGLSTLKCLKDQKMAEGQTVFVMDAGDFLQGNSYGTLTKGEASVEIMNAVGYDVGVPGNHDFDFTSEVMMQRISELNYPVICANLVYGSTNESVLDEYIVLERNGIRIGCFGLLTPETPVTTASGNMGDMTVTDPVEASERMVSLLEGMDVDCIVAIGHIGVIRNLPITSDVICQEVPGIDIFIDGHSHVEMEDGKLVDGSIDLVKSDTVIASTGAYSKTVGMISVMTDGSVSAKLYRGDALADDSIEEIIEKIHEDAEAVRSVVIGHSDVEMTGERNVVRSQEAMLGDLVADSIRHYAGTDVGMVNGGSIRATLPKGDITMGTVYDIMPFQNDIATLTVTGEQLLELCEFSVASLPASFGGFLQVSGMTFEVDLSAEPGSRVSSVTVTGEPLDTEREYTLAIPDFVANGGDGNNVLVGTPTQLSGDFAEAIADYIKELKDISENTVEMGRITAA